MESNGSSLQIAPNALDGANRHICAFFNGMDEHYRVLESFFKEGFDNGEKAFHLVDPERREDHLRRLAEAGIDVDAASASGQLEVQLDGRVAGFASRRGTSGLHRAGRWVTPTRSDPRDSATENTVEGAEGVIQKLPEEQSEGV
jgi:hypothetical protein